ncbi:MAG: reprolysin-like metallopeptidase, partial [Blastocatellia bacterium]
MKARKSAGFSLLLVIVVCAVLVIGVSVLLHGYSVKAAAQETIWHEMETEPSDQLLRQTEQTKLFRLNSEALKKVLSGAPMEAANGLPNGLPNGLADSGTVLTVPMPDGKLARFRIQESPILESPLAERYPEIKSYRGQGIDDASITMRADWSPQGFHALVLGTGEAFTVLPVARGNTTIYSSSNANQLTDKLRCEVDDSKVVYHEPNTPQAVTAAVGGTLRIYRIAIATTSEYSSQYGGGDVGQTIASINTWLNSLNAIYKKELSVRLNLIGNNSQVVYTSEPDPFTNGDGSAMLVQVRTTLRDQIGTANYDVGHVFGTGGSGVAYVGVVCSAAADGNGPFKGGGVSLMSGAAGNSTYVGLW